MNAPISATAVSPVQPPPSSGSTPPSDEQAHENKRHHLSLIQATIIRMAANAFLLKGWSVTIIVGLFALATKDGAHSVILLGVFPCVAFWFLNGYYLDQERKFRALYNHVRILPAEKIDFDLDTSKASATSGALAATFSWYLIMFYGSVLVTICGAYAVINGSRILHAVCSYYMSEK